MFTELVQSPSSDARVLVSCQVFRRWERLTGSQGRWLAPASQSPVLRFREQPVAINNVKPTSLARGPAVTKGSFLAGAHRELRVALIKCQGSVYRGCANLLARAAGRPVLPGAEVPYVD